MNDSSSLEGRSVLTAGGAIGIGRGIALELAARRARIEVTYRTRAPDVALLDRLDTL